MKTVAIIGAGAAGCFCAAELRRRAPEVAVTVFEAGPRPMAKLAITGGGRCNLTNDFEGIRSLSDAYPRGERVMKRALKAFSNDDTIRWFTERGVPCTLQEDHCWFPCSQDAMDIVRCLLRAMDGADIRVSTPVSSIKELKDSFDYVVVTTGGMSKGASMFEGLDLEIVPPVPSLFTLNIPDKSLTALMGLVVDASISIPGTAFKADGPLLITDWGVSGPATLRLSSYAARWLADNQYRGTLLVNWLGVSETEIRERLSELSESARTVANTHPAELSDRLWKMLVSRAGIRPDARWAELGSRGLARMVNVLISDSYEIAGRARFKEEFVTCGGVSLSEVRPDTLESRRIPGFFFAGEVLDIDAVTGGFNLQAAWSTAWTVAHSLVL